MADNVSKKDGRVVSGVTGVSLRVSSGRWRATITVKNKKIALGTYDRLIDAAESRYCGEVKYKKLNTDPKKSAYFYLLRSGYFKESESEFTARAKAAVDKLFDTKGSK